MEYLHHYLDIVARIIGYLVMVAAGAGGGCWAAYGVLRVVVMPLVRALEDYDAMLRLPRDREWQEGRAFAAHDDGATHR